MFSTKIGSRTGAGMLATRPKRVQRPFFAKNLSLQGRQPGDGAAGPPASAAREEPGPNVRPSAVPCTSMNSPAPVITTLKSTSARTSSL